MPQDRSIAAQIQEILGEKTIRKFFPDPVDPKNPKGNLIRFSEMADKALWWLGDNVRVEIRDATSFVIPVEGFFSLDAGPGARVKRVVRVEQQGRFFDAISTDWSEGFPTPRGHYQVRNRTFYVAGYGPLSREDQLYGSDPNLLLQTGPVTLTYFGVPTEAQLSGNQKFIRACVDYGAYLAFTDMVPKILRPKNIELEGVPKIKHNAKDYQEAAGQRLRMALESIGRVDALTDHNTP